MQLEGCASGTKRVSQQLTHIRGCNHRCIRQLPSTRTTRQASASRRQNDRYGGRAIVSAAAAEVDTLTYGSDMSTPKSSYLVLGLAHCFDRTDDGKLQDVFVIEPMSANSLECMVAGANTCFKAVTSLKLEDALPRNKELLPEAFAGGRYCDDYDFRCEASARTWGRPHAQDNLMDIVPLGSTKTNFNYNIDEKRVLNMENVVNDSDNVKQDMSIDVYGRKEEDAPEAETPATDKSDAKTEKAKKADDDDDGLDDLFSD